MRRADFFCFLAKSLLIYKENIEKNIDFFAFVLYNIIG